MKAAPRIPANLPAAGLGALNSEHVAGGGNNGVRMVAGGKRAWGGRFLGWGNRWGWSGCFSPPGTAAEALRSLQFPHRCWYSLHGEVGGGEAGGGLYLNKLIMHAPCK